MASLVAIRRAAVGTVPALVHGYGGFIMVWQLALGAFLVLLPFALLFDLHPDRERLDARGRPLRREWRVPAARQHAGDEHH